MYQEFATQRRIESRDKTLETVHGWNQAFPDSKGTIHNIFASGNQVTVELTWNGTHKGDLAGPHGDAIPASGKSVEVPATQIVTVEDGKIKETHHYFNLMTILQQIGL